MAHPLLRRIARKLLRTVHPTLPDRVEDFSLRRRSAVAPRAHRWELIDRCPIPRLDAAGVQVGPRLYLFGGYVSGDEVLNRVDVFDHVAGRWTDSFPMPADMAQSHLAACTDDSRFIYAVSGQLGNQCHPATRNSFVLDLTTRTWRSLPPLPRARYAATLQLWRGRLHLVGGSQEDRCTPSCDHWSLAVEDGAAQETGWRAEVPIPRGGPHRASAIVEGMLYVFGGQEGDYVPIPGDPTCRCTGELVSEKHHREVYALAPGSTAWERKADLAVATSHIEFAAVQFGHRMVFFGGQHDRNAETKRLVLTDAIQVYDTRLNRCDLAGHLPFRVKTNVVGHYQGSIISTCGQIDQGRHNPRPGHIVAHTWRISADRLLGTA